MLNTDEIINALSLTAKLMELHNHNPFKIKSLTNAAFTLNKLNLNLETISINELEQIKGVGKGIASKVHELQTIGTLNELEELFKITPTGILDLMQVKGLGPKKINKLWQDLNIESVGELLYACKENRLTSLKGFGEKTQTDIIKQIEFINANKGKQHYANIIGKANKIMELLKQQYPNALVAITGDIRRKSEIIDVVEIMISVEEPILTEILEKLIPIPLKLHQCKVKDFYYELFKTTGNESHQKTVLNNIGNSHTEYTSEEEIYTAAQLQFIDPELREGLQEIELAKHNKIPRLIELNNLKGVLHNHTTYSDGINTLKEMAEYCKELGYEYLGICDHSKTAVYANGLSIEKILEQHKEIEFLNKSMAPFKIFKGIESDILNDGSLDYDNDILKTFDFIVASIHSNLKMDKGKATNRLIKAIENPYTTILGHPSGRLLLSREGYPLDYKKIIDACAANNVVIELNSHPYRLDIDWRWIYYCLEKNVLISINPDAHIKEGFHDMYYGICVARKGMLTKEFCLNSMNREQITNFFSKV
jgi:DNA polymerase (family 10)